VKLSIAKEYPLPGLSSSSKPDKLQADKSIIKPIYILFF